MSKRPIVGIDTKRSARVVKDRVLTEVRGGEREKEMRRKPMMIGASAVLAVMAVLFLVLQLQNANQDGQKLTTTAPNDRLLVEVHQLTEENKKEFGAEYLKTDDNIDNYKVLKVEYYAKKKRGEEIDIYYDETMALLAHKIRGENNERFAKTTAMMQSNIDESIAKMKFQILFETASLTDEYLSAILREAEMRIVYRNLNDEETIDTITLGNYAEYIGFNKLEGEIDVYPSSVLNTSDDFIYSLEVKAPQIDKGTPFEMTATLTYVGEKDSVTIIHAASPFYYNITEMTRDFELDYAMDQPAITTVLKKGETLNHQYRLTGGYSDQDSEEFRTFVDQLLAGDTPEGSYKVHGYVQFQIEGDAEQTELGGHIGFDVK